MSSTLPGVLGELHAVLTQQRGAADEQAGAVEFGPHPHAEDDLARLVDGDVQVLFLSAGHDGPGERVAGVQFAGGGRAQHLLDRDVLTEGDDAGNQGPAEGEQVLDGTAGAAQGEGLEELADVQQPQDGQGDHVLAQHERDDGGSGDQAVRSGAAAAAQRAQGAAEEGQTCEDRDDTEEARGPEGEPGLAEQAAQCHEGQDDSAHHEPGNLPVEESGNEVETTGDSTDGPAGEREQRRNRVMQRLGNPGWADWDLVTGTITWSEQVYTIFGRDPGEGPMALEELPRHVPAGDLPALGANVERLLGGGRPVDHAFRILTPAGVRHLGIVAEAERDAEGNTVEVHGFFQDVTATSNIEHELLERQLAATAQRIQLNAERDLAARSSPPAAAVTARGRRAHRCRIPARPPGPEGQRRLVQRHRAPGGSVFAVVGDVAGHGMDSVGTMTQLRFTAKGMAVTGTPLAGILGRLNFLLLHSDESPAATTATVVLARYRPDARTLTWARAGHLPPLLVRGGRARYLDPPEGVLLGATHGARYAEATLAPDENDELFLYTDGLIEKPEEDLDESLARLVASVTATAALRRDLGELVTTLGVADEPREDVCVLRITAGRSNEQL